MPDDNLTNSTVRSLNHGAGGCNSVQLSIDGGANWVRRGAGYRGVWKGYARPADMGDGNTPNRHGHRQSGQYGDATLEFSSTPGCRRADHCADSTDDTGTPGDDIIIAPDRPLFCRISIRCYQRYSQRHAGTERQPVYCDTGAEDELTTASTVATGDYTPTVTVEDRAGNASVYAADGTGIRKY